MADVVKDSAKASTSVAGLTMMVDEPSKKVTSGNISSGKSQMKSLNETGKNDIEGSKKYTDKDLERVTRICVMIENVVGMKKIRLEEIGADVKKLYVRRDLLDEKIEKAEVEYRAIDSKGIDLSSKEFREKCYLLCKIGEMINERCSVKKKLADYTVETAKVNRAMYESENTYKTNIYLKEKIIKFLKQH